MKLILNFYLSLSQMSFGGTVHAAIISLRNNLMLRRSKQIFQGKRNLKRNPNPSRIKQIRRNPAELKRLAEAHFQRSKKVRQKQTLFLTVLFFMGMIFVWLLFF